MTAPRERSVGELLREGIARDTERMGFITLSVVEADALARVLDAADALRGVAANDWPGWQRACDAYDAARRDAIAALGREA